ncbi:cell death-inducing p53-target protein 1-like [Drosophila nasuta]|uniref:Cell death-inducing p53-target protein 1-like n=1 Tax=Drosophila albomicans TaxID=7291 RepID=A0A6P8X2I5_DROAB|nr:cell death-inducing p53-target protein 1-like [Drosophila albomicans]XP_060652271.1 cell death-inducing p53-target protein 1-like [Drosophila nasuta]
MDSKQPPPYNTIQQPQPQPGYIPAQTYQPYPSGPTQPPLYPPMPQPPPAQPPQTVIIQTTTTSNLTPIGSGPTRIRCPSCHADVVTTVKSTPSGRTHCWALILCLFVCWPCVCLPYCMDSCQNADHSCPNCGSYIGTFEN